MPELLSLDIADPPELWRDLGFTVDAGAADVGGVRHQLGAQGDGVVAWTLGGIGTFDELPTESGHRHGPGDTAHPNGVIALDHVVVMTPDLGRTTGAFEAAGVALRRTREAGPDMTQAFFKLGPVIIEVVGSPARSASGPATFWGLTFTVTDLEATAASLGARLRPVKDAVQPGRRIATLDRNAGSSVPIAFMSSAAR